jgi:multisubunit Na+/H+ antiporter MnhB subunit
MRGIITLLRVLIFITVALISYSLVTHYEQLSSEFRLYNYAAIAIGLVLFAIAPREKKSDEAWVVKE